MVEAGIGGLIHEFGVDLAGRSSSAEVDVAQRARSMSCMPTTGCVLEALMPRNMVWDGREQA